jgi:Mn-containing catalase
MILYISDPIEHVKKTKGLKDVKQTSSRTQKEVDKKNKKLSKRR